MFKKLNQTEEKEFRQWARDNYSPGAEIKTAYHPIVQEECAKINNETFVATNTENL